MQFYFIYLDDTVYQLFYNYVHYVYCVWQLNKKLELESSIRLQACSSGEVSDIVTVTAQTQTDYLCEEDTGRPTALSSSGAADIKNHQGMWYANAYTIWMKKFNIEVSYSVANLQNGTVILHTKFTYFKTQMRPYVIYCKSRGVVLAQYFCLQVYNMSAWIL